MNKHVNLCIPYLKILVDTKVYKVNLYIDAYFWNKVEDVYRNILLTRKVMHQQICKEDTPSLKPEIVNGSDIVLLLRKLYKRLYDKVREYSIEHAYRVGRHRFKNILFIPSPLKNIENIEKNLSEKYMYLFLLDDLFGYKGLLNEVNVLNQEITYYTFKLVEKPPYIYIDTKPDPLYSILYKIDELFRKTVIRIYTMVSSIS
ncbi:MAG: hypothetical protein J7K21_00860 [Desulfurococcales archaeon]|nr:hypothetical protein [Desulfurococcales archaeon]